MAKGTGKVNAVRVVRTLAQRLGTDVDGLVPTVRKLKREKEETEREA
ncbi:MAG: hypothetical protein HYS81_03490 [Candidatus Aenigmatarchaeota archaeon]|nr:MAG: hypothetical protein HYS81_03490 [Candidatus Aenigmarchaeota archaeon]